VLSHRQSTDINTNAPGRLTALLHTHTLVLQKGPL